MALRAPKKKRPKKAAYPKKRTNRALMSTAAVAIGFLLASLVFVSPALALLAVGFIILSSFIMLDNKRRAFWEKSVSFKFRKMEDNQGVLSREITRSRAHISSLKEGLSVAMTRLDEHEHYLRSGEAPLTGTPLDTKKPAWESFGPRAERPQINTEIAVNDDPFSDEPVYSETVVRELVHSAVRNERIDVFLQPIVRLPQRKTRFYEIFARIRAKPGLYISAGQYMKLARQDSLMNDIDNLLLMQCLKIIHTSAHIERATPFFLNITTDTLKNVTFMKHLLAFLSKNRDLAPRLVFEIRQTDLEDMHPAILEIMRGLGKLGCAFSLDHVEEMAFDLKFLQVLKIRFVKISAKTFMKAVAREKDFTALWKIKRQLESNGIGVIAERVENEHTLKELLDYDVNYGQGYLFGRPDLQGAYRERKAA